MNKYIEKILENAGFTIDHVGEVITIEVWRR
jgi:hypothetical protein